jgi:hypothetical protein
VGGWWWFPIFMSPKKIKGEKMYRKNKYLQEYIEDIDKEAIIRQEDKNILVSRKDKITDWFNSYSVQISRFSGLCMTSIIYNLECKYSKDLDNWLEIGIRIAKKYYITPSVMYSTYGKQYSIIKALKKRGFKPIYKQRNKNSGNMVTFWLLNI